jgi:hypothetical protein
MSDTSRSPEPSLPEDVAQRAIARAIELDTHGATRLPVARLRDIAEEAGISSQSLERALTEALGGVVPAAAPLRRMGYFHRIGRRLTGRTSASDLEAEPDLWTVRGSLEAIATNVLAFALFWFPALVLNVAARRLGYLWEEPDSTIGVLICTLGGIALAHRLRARGTQWFLVVMVVVTLVSIFATLSKSSQTPGFFGSTAFLLMVAAVLGLGVGMLVARGRERVGAGEIDQESMGDELASESVSREKSPPPGGPFLRLGIQRA